MAQRLSVKSVPEPGKAHVERSTSSYTMTKDTENEPKNPSAEIVVLASLRQGSDPLLEELNVVKLEGRYFCFDLREVPKRKGVLEYRDGNRGLKIELHPDAGQPSILAYRILQSIFRKVTLEGRPFPDTVAFTYRELGRLVGRDIFGGKDTQELLKAIRQLEDTKVTLFLYNGEKREHKWVRFSIIVTSGFIAEGTQDSPGRLKSAVLTLHPAIIDSMRRGHFVIFNWDRLLSLTPLSSALYKRLYLHFSNLFETQHTKATLRFEKDYEDVCAEWLGGLQPFPYKSRIEQQLKPHLDALKTSGLIRSWTVEKKADGKSYKLVFTPASGFFLDYDLFYHGSKARILQFQHAADEAQIKAPMEFARHFYQRLNKVEKLASDIFPEKDIEFAARLLKRYGIDECRALTAFVLAQAENTKFAIKNIKAIEIYLPSWEANRETQMKRIEQERDKAAKEREKRLQDEYHSFLKKQAFDQIESMSATERADIKQLAETTMTMKIGKGGLGYNARVAMEERRLTLERHPAPSFEQWQRSHR